MRKSTLYMTILAAALAATFVWAVAASACPGCPNSGTKEGCPYAGSKEGCPNADAKEGCPHADSKEGCPNHAKKMDKDGDGCPFATKEEALKAGLDAPVAVGAKTTCPMCAGGHEFEVKAKTQHIVLEGKHFYFCSTHCAKAFQDKFGGEITTAGAE